MPSQVQLFIEFELIGTETEFRDCVQEIFNIAKANGISLQYHFYRDPAKPAAIYAIESHPDANSLGRHFQSVFPALQKAWKQARPVRTLILGDVPPEMRAAMQANGATVVPSWLNN